MLDGLDGLLEIPYFLGEVLIGHPKLAASAVLVGLVGGATTCAVMPEPEPMVVEERSVWVDAARSVVAGWIAPDEEDAR